MRLRLLLAVLLLMGTPHTAGAADLPLYVHYLPFGPPNLFLRTTRVTQAFFNLSLIHI